MHISHILDPRDHPMKAYDLGVRIPLGPPNGRAPIAPKALVVPVILVQTPPSSLARSPKFVDASLEFDSYSSNEEPNHKASPDTNIGHSPLQPKWWAKILVDLRDDDLIDWRTAREKRKPTKSVNFSLMAKIHSVFELQTYSGAKGISEWERAMTTER